MDLVEENMVFFLNSRFIHTILTNTTFKII